MFLALSRRVIVLQQAAQVPLGDGGDWELTRAMRAHTNCAKYAPLGITLIGHAESLPVPALIVHALGLSLVAGRIVHAYGVSQESENFRFRVSGMGLTFTALGVQPAPR